MKTKIFCVYDCKAEAYLQPFFMGTKGQAIRAFTEVVNDPNHAFNKHAADYTLFEIGEYDDATAGISAHGAKQSLGTALEFKREVSTMVPLKNFVDSAMLDVRDAVEKETKKPKAV